MAFDQNKKLIKQFRDRWQAVAAIEANEEKSASVTLRWQQLNAILNMARGLGLPITEDNDDDEIVYQRWSKLKGLIK
ncbi:MAG TPA: hypothetical protein ENN22_11590 [bacterium]|nr:hypothetical protein [bacterium]